MGSRSFPSKRARLEVESTNLDRLIRALEDQGVEAAQEAFVEGVTNQMRFARERWGVRTGVSRASLTVAQSKRGPAFGVKIFSTHRPIFYQSWNGKRPTFWQVLVQRPLKKFAKKFGKAAAARLAGVAEQVPGVKRKRRNLRKKLVASSNIGPPQGGRSGGTA